VKDLGGKNYFIQERGYIYHSNQYEVCWELFMFSSYDIGDVLNLDRGSDLWIPILMLADAQKYL